MGADPRRDSLSLSWVLLALMWLAGTPAFSWAATGVPSGPVRVVALKMDADNPALDRRALLSDKLAAVIAGVGANNVDLVVVPEYTFYRGYEDEPVRIQPDGVGYFEALSLGTAKSDEIALAVAETQAWAKSNNINVILGTVAEHVTTVEDPNLPVDVTFNSQLIIDRQGRIMGFKRKVTEWQALLFPNAQIKQKALQSVRTFTLSTKSGMAFVVFPIICDDYYDADLLAKAANFNADLVVNSESVQESLLSCEIEQTTQSVQNGTWTPAEPGWIALIRNMYIRSYEAIRNIVKPGGWLVKANSFSSTGGMLELHIPPSPLAALTRTDDYVYGVIQFDVRTESSNQAPVIVSGPTVAPNPVVLPATATVQVACGDADHGPWPLTVTWSKVNGPGAVSFMPNVTASAISSVASFGAPGPYILRVEISDGEVETTHELTVLVTDGNSSTNRAPAVSAGPSGAVVFPASAQLRGMVFDDGLPNPPAVVTVAWSHSYQPGTIVFGDSHALTTTATFSKPGSFLLALTANDGVASTSSYVQIIVNAAPLPADTTAPDVAVVSPTFGSIVAGFVVVSAEASDNVGVDGVQLQLDGVDLGAEYYGDAPYTLLWDSGTASPGLHFLTAVARDAAGNVSTSAAVSVTVSGTNHWPVISASTPDSPIAVLAGTTTTFSVDAHDDDGDALFYAWTLDGIVEPVTAHTLNYSPLDGDVGSHSLVATVSDGNGGSATQVWGVTVTEVDSDDGQPASDSGNSMDGGLIDDSDAGGDFTDESFADGSPADTGVPDGGSPDADGGGPSTRDGGSPDVSSAGLIQGGCGCAATNSPADMMVLMLMLVGGSSSRNRAFKCQKHRRR